MLYPLFFYPIHKDRIWGGRKLADTYNRQLDSDHIGESWEISCHENGMGRIQNGALKGTSLQEAIENHGVELLGSAIYQEEYRKFPLLIKLLDAADVLSVQVHPNDIYADTHENGELGKTEMWYVIDAKPGAKLVYGMKEGCDKDGFRKSLEEGRLEDCLKELEVSSGDVLYIPAGLVHAIGEGILICEIQQNSDTTYRVYDWNRVDETGRGRQLHIDQAIDVIGFHDKMPEGKLPGLVIPEPGGQRILYVASDYFAMEEWNVNGTMEIAMDGRRFQTLTCIEGQASLVFEGGQEALLAGTSCLIPASLPDVKISGNCTVIRSWVPDKNQMIRALMNKGYTENQLSVVAGLLDR